MPAAYDALYAWMHAAFGGEPLSVDDFRATFPSPAPAKVLSDLHRLGYLESEARGTYRVVAPEERTRRVVEREEAYVGFASRTNLPHAYCDDTAVTIWTDGGYWTGFSRGFRPLHLRVRREDLRAWRDAFRAAGARMSVAGARETLFGVVHILHPAKRVRSVDRGGVRVVPIDEAYAYAAARPYLFEPALPVLDSLRRESKG